MLDRLLSAGKPPEPVRKTIDKKKKGKGDAGSIVRVIETAIHGGKIFERLSESAVHSAALKSDIKTVDRHSNVDAALVILLTTSSRQSTALPLPRNCPPKGWRWSCCLRTLFLK